MQRQKLPMPAELAVATAAAPKILIVDDEESVTRWIAGEIRTEHPHCDVRHAHDGFAAGELVGTWNPDVVILDLHMPGMDGFEVCRRIKARQATMNTAVIAATADTSDEAEREILECGARICLRKPLDSAALLNEIESCL